MTLTERIIELSVWWGALALAATAVWVASQQSKNDPAHAVEDECEAANETITTRETA